MASLNKIILIGNVGTDPEMRYTPNGNPVTSFRMATNYRYTGPNGEPREETAWFRVIAWRKLAEQCNEFLAKGRQVYVEGRLRTRNWEGQDGQTRVSIEVVANRVLFLGRPAVTSPPEKDELEPEDIPFEQNEGVGD